MSSTMVKPSEEEFKEETIEEEKVEEVEKVEESEVSEVEIGEVAKEEVVTEEEVKERIVEEVVYRLMFPKGKEVKYVFTALANLLHEANLVISPDGIKLKSIDPSKVSLIILDIPSVNLEDFQVSSEVKIGLVFDLLKKIVKRVKARDKVEFAVDLGKNKFYLTIYTKKGREGGLYRRFGIPIINIAEEEVPEPSLTFPVRIKMDVDVFTDIVAAADEVSDSVTLVAKPESFIIKAVGEGGKLLEAEYSSRDEAIYEYDVEEACESTYSTEFILDITRQMKQISEYVLIEFGSNKPLKLTFEFAVGKVLYFLAPRVS